MVRLGKVYSDDGKYDDAIAQFDKVMAMQDINVTVRQVAQAERVRTIQKKNPAKPPTRRRQRRPRRTRAANPQRRSRRFPIMRADLDALEVAAGHRFADREILRRALTHSSHVHEQALAGGRPRRATTSSSSSWATPCWVS
jgi:hypothetical protein